MPNFISKIHDDLMFNFIRTGKSTYINNSSRITWAQDCSGFIFPINMYLTLNIGYYTEELNIYGTLVKFF